MNILLIIIYISFPLFLVLYALFSYVETKSYERGFKDYKQMLKDLNMKAVPKDSDE